MPRDTMSATHVFTRSAAETLLSIQLSLLLETVYRSLKMQVGQVSLMCCRTNGSKHPSSISLTYDASINK